MLQQTQVATVLPYYENWLRQYPDPKSLADVSEEKALADWQGLGYYRRCRLLKKGAEFVAANGMPQTYEDWRNVPGVGIYTASAIASIAFNEPKAVVDGNVERVFARYNASVKVGKDRVSAAQHWADEMLIPSSPGDWNQAMMELGATVCTPRKPKCKLCPVKDGCMGRQIGAPEDYPAKDKRPATIVLHHLCWVPYCKGKLGVRQIEKGPWWRGMWEFPRVEVEHHSQLSTPELEKMFPNSWPEDLGMLQHHVTNHRIYLRSCIVRLDKAPKGLVWVGKDELQTLAMPSPQRKVLQAALNVVSVKES